MIFESGNEGAEVLETCFLGNDCIYDYYSFNNWHLAVWFLRENDWDTMKNC